MTHLLATLLAGGRFGPVDPAKAQTPARPESQEAFGRVLEEAGNRHQDGADSAPGDRPVQERPAEARRADGESASGRPAAGGENGNGFGPASGTRITLLGAIPGARLNLPSLTFVLPAGAGTADLAAAVRTQVLRMSATRQMEPGALDNLRLAISSRELGQVDVEMNASGDRLKIEITAAGREAESALRRGSGDLKEAILARGDRFRQVEVRVDGRTLREGEDAREDHPGRSDQEGRGDHRKHREHERDDDGTSRPDE